MYIFGHVVALVCLHGPHTGSVSRLHDQAAITISAESTLSSRCVPHSSFLAYIRVMWCGHVCRVSGQQEQPIIEGSAQLRKAAIYCPHFKYPMTNVHADINMANNHLQVYTSLIHAVIYPSSHSSMQSFIHAFSLIHLHTYSFIHLFARSVIVCLAWSQVNAVLSCCMRSWFWQVCLLRHYPLGSACVMQT